MAMSDLEKGRVRPASRSSSPSKSTPHVAFPQRRRRSYLILFLLGAVIFTAYSFDSSYSHSISAGSWNWVKDSMRPAEHKVDNAVVMEDRPMADPQKASAAQVEAADEADGVATAATKEAVQYSLDQAPSSADQILFFFSVMKDKAYKVPESEAVRKKELMPGTRKQLLQSIVKLRADEAKDADLVSAMSTLDSIEIANDIEYYSTKRPMQPG